MTLDAYIRQHAPTIGAKWRYSHGDCAGAYTGGTKPAERRVALLIQTIIGSVLLTVDRDYSMDLEFNNDGRPTDLILSRPGVGARIVPLAMTAKVLSVDGYTGRDAVALSGRTCGRDLTAIIARECSAYFPAMVAQ